MRTLQGYVNEANNIKAYIQKEKEYLDNGTRLGTWHNPKQRIKESTEQLQKIEAHILKQTSLNL